MTVLTRWDPFRATATLQDRMNPYSQKNHTRSAVVLKSILSPVVFVPR
jgi:hypothetical protein